ncbi:ABC transporter permease [Streptomyces profundus]|uniref:ABC transporter permease n=1 Tax=Streptomyces profundus TaxID=2867410 RepID=UPI001D1675E3|nr:ABC transporter permease [Streptomyces sp. MA3_2.13]UED87520.1 ABC transporter permease [Streptomyces sp. MA3_2.13]
MSGRGRTALRGLAALGAALGLPLALLALWWVASEDSTHVYLPPLRDILEAFGRVWFSETFVGDVVPSLRRLGIGLGIAFVLGVTGGYLLGRSPLLRGLASPALAYARALPPPVIIPVLLVAVGIGETTKIVVIALGALWPILLNTCDGVRDVDEVARETAAAYRLTGWTRRRLVLRAASPRVFAGLRQALGLAIILMVVSEMLMSTDGLGFTIVQFQRSFALPEMWSGVLLLGVLGFVLAKLLELVERHALRWHRGMTGRQESST